jgi:hypothetical protein
MKLFVLLLFLALSVFMFPIEGFTLLFVSYILYGPLRAATLFAKFLFKKNK